MVLKIIEVFDREDEYVQVLCKGESGYINARVYMDWVIDPEVSFHECDEFGSETEYVKYLGTFSVDIRDIVQLAWQQLLNGVK